MFRNTAAEVNPLLGPIPTFLLMVFLSPLFLLLALLYVCRHSHRGDTPGQEIAVGDLIATP